MSGSTTFDHYLLDQKDAASEPVLPPTETARARTAALGQLDWRQLLGSALIAAGLVAVIGTWIGVSGTYSTASQLAYLASGGVGGMALIAVGILLIVTYEHRQDRTTLLALDARLRNMEDGMAEELEGLYRIVGNSNGRAEGSARSSA